MTHELTRRGFGLLSLGAVAMGLPRLSRAQSRGYANPNLLETAENLISAQSQKTGDQSKQGYGFVVVDIRPRKAYDAGHIPGATHLDANAVVASHSPVDGTLLPIDAIEDLLGRLGIRADSRVVFYDDRGGFHAARMFWLLEYLGHRNVAVLNGGWSAWQAAGGQIAHDGSTYEGSVFQSALSPRRHATAADVLDHRNATGAVLIDVRPPNMYAEGHIPWAKNVPWSQNLDANGQFLLAAELAAHFEANGVTPEKDVIMHCQNGLASAHSYVALRLLGFPRVRVYHRSWAEWGNDPALPKVTS